MNNLGTWIDWQYLHNAAKLLAKVLAITYLDKLPGKFVYIKFKNISLLSRKKEQ